MMVKKISDGTWNLIEELGQLNEKNNLAVMDTKHRLAKETVQILKARQQKLEKTDNKKCLEEINQEIFELELFVHSIC